MHYMVKPRSKIVFFPPLPKKKTPSRSLAAASSGAGDCKTSAAMAPQNPPVMYLSPIMTSVHFSLLRGTHWRTSNWRCH